MNLNLIIYLGLLEILLGNLLPITKMGTGPQNQQDAAHNLLILLQTNQTMVLLQNIYIGISSAKLLILLFIFSLALSVFLLILTRKLALFRYYKNQPYVLYLIKPPHNSTQSTFSTAELFTVIHALGREVSFTDQVLGRKKLLSCELVSTKEEGIRYLLRVPLTYSEAIRKSLYAYLPGVVVEEKEDYLPDKLEDMPDGKWLSTTFTLSGHFLLPLQSQIALSQHDPMSYITSHMTKLGAGDLIALQVVLTPLTRKTHPRKMKAVNKMERLIHKGFDIRRVLNRRNTPFRFAVRTVKLAFMATALVFLFPVAILLIVLAFAIELPILAIFLLLLGRRGQGEQSPRQRELTQAVGAKTSEELFEATVRVLLVQGDVGDLNGRLGGLVSSLAVFSNSYQGFRLKRGFPFEQLSFRQLKYRLLSFGVNPILSVTEVSSLYHLPFSTSTKTEDLVNLKSRVLPAPLALKQMGTKLDVVFAKNSYGGADTPIGLTLEERRRHVYVLGATGTGKSTLLLSTISSDLKNGKGMAIIDPHGDLAEDVLRSVPEKRAKDVIYFNPDDLEHPIGLNLLELTPGLGEYDALREKEYVAESVVSLFRKVFSDNLGVTPHRIEYILRNTIYTAFTVPNATIFTLYDLLNDPSYRRSVTKNLTDARLAKFWSNEFGKAGSWQKIKMTSSIDARIGRFLFSPSARRILEQSKSSINFDEILDQGKILVCNLAKGKIGEDTAQVLGITILNKIHLAALSRARAEQEHRQDFFLYVDEFQHFATSSFIDMLSEARKYRLNLAIAEQSTSQQNDLVVNQILANVGTTIMFRSANPIDEEMILPQFYPHVVKGEIANLPAFHFYMKAGALRPQDPFSGETVPIDTTNSKDTVSQMIEDSRERYATLVSEEIRGDLVTKPRKGKAVPGS